MVIDGLAWFLAGISCLVGAVLCCGLHALQIRDWRRERRRMLAELRAYEEADERRHAELMKASTWYQRASLGWSKPGKA